MMSRPDVEPAGEAPKANTVCVPFPREVVERELICDLLALRDERVLARLSEEDRRRLGDDPVAGLPYLTTEEVAGIGSVTNGTFCHGTPSFSKGVTCKIFKISEPAG
jgi:hypothetical protein